MEFRNTERVLLKDFSSFNVRVFSETKLGGIAQTHISVNDEPCDIREKHFELFDKNYIPVHRADISFVVVMDGDGRYHIFDSDEWKAEQKQIKENFSNGSIEAKRYVSFRIMIELLASVLICNGLCFARLGLLFVRYIPQMFLLGIGLALVIELLHRQQDKKKIKNFLENVVI